MMHVGCVAASVICLAAPMAQGATIVETAAYDGDFSGGPTLTGQFMGVRFSVTERTLITSIGAAMATYGGSVWGAIIALPSPEFVPPTGYDIEAAALGYALFDTNQSLQDASAAMNLTIEAGDYALVFGDAGHFGSTGTGVMDWSDTPLGSHDWLWRSSGGLWRTTAAPENTRMVVEGVAVIPLPSGAALGLMGLVGVAGLRRRR